MELVNRDVGKFKTAELISSFCDRIMKTGSAEKLSDAEIETFLEKVPLCVMSLFSICVHMNELRYISVCGDVWRFVLFSLSL